jgi:hypothetical protein
MGGSGGRWKVRKWTRKGKRKEREGRMGEGVGKE